MDEETLTLGRTEQKRVLVLNQLLAGLVTGEQAATLRGRSPRQVQRLKAAYQARGAAAVVHGNRGRTPAWTTPTEQAARRALTHLPAPDSSSGPRVCTPSPVPTGEGVSERMRRG